MAPLNFLFLNFFVLSSDYNVASVPTIPAEIAYNCLKSVPIVKEDALQIVTSLAPYFEFQTTIGFLKDPPSGYLLPGVDILGGLARIESHVRDDVYSSEYDFELDLFTLVLSAHDGHFNYRPDIFSGVFEFRRTQSLASISKDGLDLPKIYFQNDLRQSENSSFFPSPVILIDGKDAVAFLQDWAFGAIETQDPDAAYNRLFSSIVGSTPVFLSSQLYPGATTTYSFENGTNKSFPNKAISLIDLKGIRSGKDLYTKVLDAEVSPTPSSSTSTKSEIPLPTGYPLPVVKHSSNLISGFFLRDSAYNDVAVLSVTSFDPRNTTNPTAEIREFQKTLQEFLAEAKKSRKTKLIIDIQGNGGGLIALGVELFAQLFPSLTAYSGLNMRANRVNEILGQIISGLNASSQAYKVDLDYNITANPDSLIAWTPYNYRQDVLPGGSAPYASWSEVFGPVVTSHDNLTNVFRNNYTDPLWVNVAQLIITGTGNRTDFAQPFAAENIVILSDGNCASTCATFSEYMKTQIGVPTIVAGGRPQYGPMQGVGGTKGGEVVPFELLASSITRAYLQAPPDLQGQLNETSILEASYYPLNRSTYSRFNFLNRIRQGDTSVTPLQFVYEAADCRFFYTAEMHANVSTIWTRVASMAFGKSLTPQQDWSRNPYCVRSSTNHPSSVSGGGPNNTDYAGSTPPAGAKSQAQLPQLSDGTRMGWRLNLPTVYRG
ncbi:hypothetical protein MMC22_005510 [Lobaria immixta]|nr:hypothetical protein [Lobaria immixta]